MRRLGLTILLTILCFFGVALPVRAATDFTKSLNVSYTVLDTGETAVKYEVRLKNNFSTVYAKQYVLTVNSPDVKNVAVFNQDNKSEKFELSQTETQSTISVFFSDQDRVIGRDRERLFAVTYLSKDTASVYGNAVEVSIPKLADPDSYSQYNVVVSVPERFGQPSLVEPSRYTIDTGVGQSVLRFTNAGQKTGISLLFGESQAYEAELIYHVQNTSQNVGVVQVALPPDTAYQRIAFREITPRPEKITTDLDGNWIAEFRVAGQAQQDVKVLAHVTVYTRPQSEIATTNPLRPTAASTRLFSAPDRSVYLQSTNFWPTSNATLGKIASDHSTPQAIYQYVVDTLQYNYKRFQQPDAQTRLGAVGAIQDPSNAICLEYTDLFIALSRIAGVPARRVTGYAIAQNSRLRPLSLVADVLHAWPEYYDVQRSLWVPVDPTWGDTTGGIDYFSKLDLRHIVFAIQGQYEDRPYPAGMYKVVGQEEKDVSVKLSEALAPELAPYTVEKRPSYLPQFGIPTQETFVISNPSGTARYNVEVAVGVQGQASLLSAPTHTIPVLLPYQSTEVSVALTGTSWLHAQKASITLFVGDKEHSYEVNVRKSFVSPAARWVVMGGGIALVSLFAGSVLVFIARRFRPVRRKS
jgi:transglutaminase-like putative cysteine protease